MDKDTFIIRTEWFAAIAELDIIDQATILRNLFLFHTDQPIILDTFPVRIVWKLIEPTLTRSADAYDKRRDTSRSNGLKGGRPQKPIILEDEEINQTNNQNNLTEPNPKPNIPNITLSDSVSDSVSVSESESESDTAGKTLLATPTIIKSINQNHKTLPPEQALPPPDPATPEPYYEQLCMSHSISLPTLQLIHTAWLGDRISIQYTTRDARTNFSGYCAKWIANNEDRKNRHGPKKIIQPTTTSTKDKYI